VTQFVLAVVLGLLFAFGTFLVLRRDILRVVWGVVIYSQAANVYLITMGGLSGVAPIISGHAVENPDTVTDPLVQALVLTAIVISFGTTAFALVLTYRIYEEHGTIDLQKLGETGGEV
jgi:multicomponent Na+:H+ antiporter subunit C